MLDVITIKDLWDKDTDGYLPVLIEIYNPDITWTDEEIKVYGQSNGYLRLISDVSRVIYKNKTWLPCSFDITLPEKDGKKFGNASISISALDARVRRILRIMKVRCEFKIIAVFNKVKKEDSEKYIYKFAEVQSYTLYMTTASMNKSTATFSLTFDKAVQQNIPYDVATQDRVPSISV